MFHVEDTRVTLSEFIYTSSIKAEEFGDMSIYCYQTAFFRIPQYGNLQSMSLWDFHSSRWKCW